MHFTGRVFLKQNNIPTEEDLYPVLEQYWENTEKREYNTFVEWRSSCQSDETGGGGSGGGGYVSMSTMFTRAGDTAVNAIPCVFRNEAEIITALNNGPEELYAGQTINLFAVYHAPVTFVFNGNGLYFDEDGTEAVNTVTYANVCTIQHGYVGNTYEEVMSSNIEPGGIQNGSYTYNENLTQTVNIPGADKLKVVVDYGITDSTMYIGIMEGTSDSNYRVGYIVSYEDDISGTETYIVDGDTATIYIDSWNYPKGGSDYGAYVRVYPIYDEAHEGATYESYEYCKWQAVDGDYTLPELGEYDNFIEWQGSCPSNNSGGNVSRAAIVSEDPIYSMPCVFHDEAEILAALSNDINGLYFGQTIYLDAIYQSPVTFVFNGNGLYFDEEDTEETNTVVYADTCAMQSGYVGDTPVISKTPNIGDDGVQNGSNTNMDAYDPITIPGASKLKIVISYDNTIDGRTKVYYTPGVAIVQDWQDWHEYEWTELSGSSNDEVIVVGGDTVTFNTYIYNSDGSNDYGYYARVYPIYEEEYENTNYESYEYCGWQAAEGQYKNIYTTEDEAFYAWYGYIPSINDGFSFDNEQEIISIINEHARDLSGQTIQLNADWGCRVTVSMDSGISSVTFWDSSSGIEQIATPLHPTVWLKSGVTYDITADPVLGYEFTGWSTTNNGVLDSTTDNPTSYTVSGAATLSAISSEIPTYQVTVNMDAHSTSVSFTNADYGVQTVVNQGNNGDGTHTGTVSLRRGVEYTINGTFDIANQYIFSSWSATGDGAIGGTANGAATTFTVTGDASLNLTSKQRTGTATLIDGKSLNAKMKTLAKGSGAALTYSSSSSMIKALREASYLPSGFTPAAKNTVSTNDSEKPVYIFFDNTNDAGIMYFYTEARDVYMDADSSYAFYYHMALTDLSALANWDTSKVTNMSYMFYFTKITNIDALANWDTSKVTNMSAMFNGATSLANIDGARNWDTSKVTDMNYMLLRATSLTNIDGARNWDTSKVTSMISMFKDTTSLTNIDGARNWDTSKVTNMWSMFNGATSLTDIDALESWDTGNVQKMSSMFEGATSLTDIGALENWDTGNVQKMSSMFDGATSLTDIDALANWNTSAVSDMSYMFKNTQISNASVINDWMVGSVSATVGSSTSLKNDFYQMFYKVPSRPTFTRRIGYWDDSGTFIPQSVSIINVTVNFDEHIEGIRFYNDIYGTRTVSKDGGVVALFKNERYTVTAIVKEGYELSSWSNENSGTFSSATSNPTTYRENGDDTIRATSTAIPDSTSTVTVNMDSHVTNVKFINPDYGIETVAADGGTVTLVKNLNYYIAVDYEHGYANNTLATTANGTTGETTVNGMRYTVTGDDNVTITSKQKTGTATLDTGQNLGTKMKTLAGNYNISYDDYSAGIKSLQMASYLPSDFVPTAANTVSTNGSEKPIYIFFNNTNDADIMYFYTEARDIYMNADSSCAFHKNVMLTDISALSNWDTSNVTDMSKMFDGNRNLADISALTNWSTGNVTDMSYMFQNVHQLPNIDALANWNTGNVTDMSYMFDNYTKGGRIRNVNGASNWNTGNVTNMSHMFRSNGALNNISGLSNWNTGNVTDMSYMFYGDSDIIDISALTDWDTHNVTDMKYMFTYLNDLASIAPLANWNTGNVTDMDHMFYVEDWYSSAGWHDISPLANWDTSNVTNMQWMFYGRGISRASSLDGWDIRNVIASNDSNSKTNFFFAMFGYPDGCANTPHFYKRLGTWNCEIGYYNTFVPSSTPSHIVTINLGAHTQKVRFYKNGDTADIVKDGDFIAMADGGSYTITATMNDGYTFGSWSTTTGGTLDNATSNPTTYVATADATLTVIDQATMNSPQSSPSGTQTASFNSALSQSSPVTINSTTSSSELADDTLSNLSNGYAAPQGVSNTVGPDGVDLSPVIILASAAGAAASGIFAIFFAKRKKEDNHEDEY